MNVSTITPLSASNTTNVTANVTEGKEEKFLPWDNPGNIISLEQLQVIETTICCGLEPLMLIIGVPGNLISSLVYSKRGLRDRMNVTLFSLGLVDLFTVFFFCLLGSFCPVSKMFYKGSNNITVKLYKWKIRKYVRGEYEFRGGGAFTFLSALPDSPDSVYFISLDPVPLHDGGTHWALPTYITVNDL